MSEKEIEAIIKALDRGQRIELTKQKDGSIKIRTVWRKDLKI